MAFAAAAAITAAAIAGEEALHFISNVLTLGDGTWINVVLDKPAYYAGETMTGRVMAHVVSPITCDEVVVKIAAKTKVKWDEERAETIFEGEGENRTSRTVWHHEERKTKDKIFKQTIVVSRVTATLMPGDWAWPFSFPIPAGLPGIMKYSKSVKSHDPAFHEKLKTEASIVFTCKAAVNTRGVFSRDLKARQELVVNPYFDWAKLVPQAVLKKGEVYWCCCIPQGEITLDCKFDKAAYAAGETAQISAAIKNDSACNVSNMLVKLMRVITLVDDHGHHKYISDELARATYEGVAAKTASGRYLPLPLKSSAGGFISSIDSKFVKVRYQIEVECDIPMAFDIEAHLPIIVYQPAPAVVASPYAFAPGAVVMGGGAGAGAGAMPMMPGAGMGMPGHM